MIRKIAPAAGSRPGARSTRPGISGWPPRPRHPRARPRRTRRTAPRWPASITQPQTGQPCSCPSTSGTTSRPSATRQHHQAGQVEPAPRSPGSTGQQRGRRPAAGQADRHVDQEHRPPAGAEQVRADQHPAERPGRPPARPRAPPSTARAPWTRAAPGEGALDQADHLRDHQRRAGALDAAGSRSASRCPAPARRRARRR